MRNVVNTAYLKGENFTLKAESIVHKKGWCNIMYCVNNCCNFEVVKVTEIKLVNSTLVFVIPTETLYNGMTRCICVTGEIPSYTGTPNIAIEIGGTAYTSLATNVCGYYGVKTCVPNNLYVDQLRLTCTGSIKTGEIYKFSFATDTNCWNLCDMVRPSSAV